MLYLTNITQKTVFHILAGNIVGKEEKTQLLTTQSRLLMTLKKKAFENIVGKEENGGNQHFLLFPQRFLSVPKQMSILQLHLFFFCRSFEIGSG